MTGTRRSINFKRLTLSTVFFAFAFFLMGMSIYTQINPNSWWAVVTPAGYPRVADSEGLAGLSVVAIFCGIMSEAARRIQI